MIGLAQFQAMNRGSHFIALWGCNVYDTPSLVKALDSKQLAGTGVDVTDPEPLPPGHPLWKFGNAIVTPHVAPQGVLGSLLRAMVYEETIVRLAAGALLINVVDVRKEC